MPEGAMQQDLTGPDLSRVVARISSAYFLRSLRLLADFHDADIITAAVFLSIIVANTEHLDQRDHGGRPPGTDGPVPDAMRRPVSILAISESLGLPFETTRRHVKKLSANGRCVRVRKGLIVPQAVIEDDVVRGMRRANLANLRMMMRDLNRVAFAAD
jgi:hypothetical protein